MADRILNGQLDALLADRRAAKVSFEAIARELRDRGVVEITGETVRQWFNDLEPEPTEVAS